MAPGQNTFSIIPNAPCAINTGLDPSQSRPAARPMTTKQARKAYQKKNKAPKLSKAEQRRLDLLEQDRIRKEFEKEKNQARARAARDKKKEKEEKDRAERRKKGLPLVDVRPSQNTIAWFVRGDKQKQETRTASPTTIATEDSDNGTLSADDEPEPPPKRQKTDISVQESPEPEHCPSPAEVLGTPPFAPQVPSTQEVTTSDSVPVKEHLTPGESSLGLDDPGIVDEPLDELVNIPSSLPNDGETPRCNEPLPEEQDIHISNHVPQSPPHPKSPDNRPVSPISSQKLPREQKAEDSASLLSVRQPLQDLIEDETNIRSENKPKESTPGPTKLSKEAITDSAIQAPRKSQPRISAPPSFRHPKTPMGPPQLPPKFKTPSHTLISGPRTPGFLVKQPQAPKFKSTNVPLSRPHKNQIPQRTGEVQPPTSTQLFMFSHLDDFFPSPSQEVREVFGEPKPYFRKNTFPTKPKPRPSSKPLHPIRPPPGRNPLSVSTPSVLNIDRTAPKVKESIDETGFTQHTMSTNQSKNSTSPLAADARFSNNSEAFHLPFFSTQDFFLSSQDIKDLEDETPSSLGIKPVDDLTLLTHTPKAVDPTLPETIKNKPGTSPLASVHQLTSKQIEKLEPNSGTKSINTHGQSPLIRTSGTLGKGYKGSTVVITNTTKPSMLEERTCLIKDIPENEAKPVGKSGNRAPDATSIGYKSHALGTVQTKPHVTQPRASPKPFFGSSNKDAQYKFIIERSKTTRWETAAARQKVQQQSEYLKKSEDERFNCLLREAAPEDKTPSSGSEVPTDSRFRACSQPKTKGQSPPPLTVNQLSRPSQKKAEPTEDRQRRSHSRSPYEMMLADLEELGHKESHKQDQQVSPAVQASQETDYGDAGLDDVLYEML